MSEWKFVKEVVARENKHGKKFNADSREISPFEVPDGIIEEATEFITELVDLLERHDVHILEDSECGDIAMRFNRESVFTMYYEQSLGFDVASGGVCTARIEEVELCYHRRCLVGKLVRQESEQ